MNPARAFRGWPVLAALLAAGLPLARPAAAQTSLIIYRDGRVLVRRILSVTVPRGTSRHLVELDQLDPGSLVALDPGLSITDVDYPRTLDAATLYRAALGRRLVFQLPGSGDTVSALVAGEDPPRFELGNGRVSLVAPGTPLFPGELAGVARPTTIVVESEQARPRLALGYMTTGVQWNAEVSGRVAMLSDEVRADSAELSILEGQVSRASGFQRDRPRPDAMRLEELVVTGTVAGGQGPPAAAIGIGGFRVYRLPGRHSLAPGRTTVARLFPPVQVAVERVSLVTSFGIQPGAPELELPVEVHYRIPRGRDVPFGAEALPPGLARVYSRTPDGGMVLVGEALVARADPGQLMDLTAGRTVTLSARRAPVKAAMVQDSVIGADGRPMVSGNGQVAELEVRFSIVADTVAAVEFQEHLLPQSRLISSSVPVQDLGAGQLRFRIEVPARGEGILRYRVRISP